MAVDTYRNIHIEEDQKLREYSEKLLALRTPGVIAIQNAREKISSIKRICYLPRKTRRG